MPNGNILFAFLKLFLDFNSRQYSNKQTTKKKVTQPSIKTTNRPGDDGTSIISSTVPLNESDTLVVIDPDDGKSIGRDFAPIFYILTVLIGIVLLGLITTIYRRRGFNFFPRRFQTNQHLAYSQLRAENEFDLN